MSVLQSFARALGEGAVQVVDLTSRLHAGTPILALPPEMGQTARFELEEISRYDDRGPAWYWNNFRTGEHTGTHFDARTTGSPARTSTMSLRCRPRAWSVPRS